MLITNEFFRKRFLLGLISILLLVLLGFLITNSYSSLNKSFKIRNSIMIDSIDQRLTTLFLEINNFPRSVGNDVLFLSELSSFKDAYESGFSYHGIENIKKDFLELLKLSPAYYQLRYIDEKGQEIVRVESDGHDNYKVVPKDELQNKKHRYYFSKTINLNEGEIYISPLDLNIERGKIENRGTKEDPEYVPVMRYGTPIFNEQNNAEGIIFVNIYVDYFLEEIRRSQRENETVVLINNEGYYLVHPDKEKEFAFMLGGTDNFFRDYPEVPEQIFLDSGKKRLETDNLIFSFKRVYPTIGNFGIHKASEKIFGENPENNYFWAIVSISKQNEIDKGWGNSKGNRLSPLFFSGVVILTVVILIFILGSKIPVKNKKKDRCTRH